MLNKALENFEKLEAKEDIKKVNLSIAELEETSVSKA